MDDSLYRITKVIPNKSLILETEPGSTSFDAGPDTWTYIFGERKAQIHSVKRLSDGEVFTVGDRVRGLSQTGVIESFFIDNHCILINKTEKEIAQFRLDHLSKLTPLFKTEDGVEIFEGDEYWCVHAELTGKPSKCTSADIVFSPHISFSTKAVAEAYVFENKVSLTAKEVIALRRSTDSESAFVHSIKQLVISKL